MLRVRYKRQKFAGETHKSYLKFFKHYSESIKRNSTHINSKYEVLRFLQFVYLRAL